MRPPPAVNIGEVPETQNQNPIPQLVGQGEGKKSIQPATKSYIKQLNPDIDVGQGEGKKSIQPATKSDIKELNPDIDVDARWTGPKADSFLLRMQARDLQKEVQA